MSGRCLISRMVPAVAASARSTLAWRGQNGVESMKTTCFLHHQVAQIWPLASS